MKLTNNQIGTIHELQATCHLIAMGLDVFFPANQHSGTDLITMDPVTGKIESYQVKSACVIRGFLHANVNQYNRPIPAFDWMLVVSPDGNRYWRLPAADVAGRSTLSFGKQINPHHSDHWRFPSKPS